MISSSTCVSLCSFSNHLAGEQSQWDWPASSIPPIPACKYEIFMVELPTVIKARLTTIWAARGGQLKRQLIHKLYSVTLLTRGFSALQNAKVRTMLLIAFIYPPLSLFHNLSLSVSWHPSASLRKHQHTGCVSHSKCR